MFYTFTYTYYTAFILDKSYFFWNIRRILSQPVSWGIWLELEAIALSVNSLSTASGKKNSRAHSTQENSLFIIIYYKIFRFKHTHFVRLCCIRNVKKQAASCLCHRDNKKLHSPSFDTKHLTSVLG